jgi:hypothetical protein
MQPIPQSICTCVCAYVCLPLHNVSCQEWLWYVSSLSHIPANRQEGDSDLVGETKSWFGYHPFPLYLCLSPRGRLSPEGMPSKIIYEGTMYSLIEEQSNPGGPSSGSSRYQTWKKNQYMWTQLIEISTNVLSNFACIKPANVIEDQRRTDVLGTGFDIERFVFSTFVGTAYWEIKSTVEWHPPREVRAASINPDNGVAPINPRMVELSVESKGASLLW